MLMSSILMKLPKNMYPTYQFKAQIIIKLIQQFIYNIFQIYSIQIFWLNGGVSGPGCSSFIAFSKGVGPCNFDDNLVDEKG